MLAHCLVVRTCGSSKHGAQFLGQIGHDRYRSRDIGLGPINGYASKTNPPIGTPYQPQSQPAETPATAVARNETARLQTRPTKNSCMASAPALSAAASGTYGLWGQERLAISSARIKAGTVSYGTCASP